MHPRTPTLRPPRRERGAVLFVALILLVILSLLGVSAARMQTTEERMARNEDNRQTGAQAAEAGLRYAESQINSGAINTSTCDGNTNGQYTLSPTAGSVVTGSTVAGIPWSSAAAPTVMTYAGPNLTAIPANAQKPLIVVESLPAVCLPGNPCSQQGYNGHAPGVAQYRVTAYGQGADSSSYTILQSIFRGD